MAGSDFGNRTEVDMKRALDLLQLVTIALCALAVESPVEAGTIDFETPRGHQVLTAYVSGGVTFTAPGGVVLLGEGLAVGECDFAGANQMLGPLFGEAEAGSNPIVATFAADTPVTMVS